MTTNESAVISFDRDTDLNYEINETRELPANQTGLKTNTEVRGGKHLVISVGLKSDCST